MAARKKKTTKKSSTKKIDEEVNAEIFKDPSKKITSPISEIIKRLTTVLGSGILNTITSQLDRIINHITMFTEDKIIEIEKRVLSRLYAFALIIIAFVFLSLTIMSFFNDIVGIPPVMTFLIVSVIFFTLGFIYEVVSFKKK